jgi:hypothetical protein
MFIWGIGWIGLRLVLKSPLWLAPVVYLSPSSPLEIRICIKNVLYLINVGACNCSLHAGGWASSWGMVALQAALLNCWLP